MLLVSAVSLFLPSAPISTDLSASVFPASKVTSCKAEFARESSVPLVKFLQVMAYSARMFLLSAMPMTRSPETASAARIAAIP